MSEIIKKTREYLDYMEEHYNNVQKAWKLIQKKCKDMRIIYDDFCFFTIDNLIKNHDISKLSKEELVQYREHFYPVNDKEKENSSMELAWKHHKKVNSHHWENWTMNCDGYPYADIYLIDNLCDWIAMGFKFGDTAKDYYEKNKNEIKLPEWAIKLMYKIFDRIYK